MKHKMEFSKISFIAIFVFVIIIVIASFVVLVISPILGITDFSILTVISSAAIALLNFSYNRYSRKAETENKIKLANIVKEQQVDLETLRAVNEVYESGDNVSGNF